MLKQQILDYLNMKLLQASSAVEKLKNAQTESSTNTIEQVLVTMNTMINSLQSLKDQVELGSVPEDKLELLQTQLYASFEEETFFLDEEALNSELVSQQMTSPSQKVDN